MQGKHVHRVALFAAVGCASLFAVSARGDIVAHYPFNETSGTTATDAVGSIDGTLQGTASFVAGGIQGNAVSLTSTGDGVVNMGNNFGFLSGDYSVSFWINTTTTEADTVALSKHSAGIESGYLFAVGPTGGGGAVGKANFTASTFVSNGVTSTTTVNNGVWHHIVGVYTDGAIHSIYVDGAPAEQTKPSSDIINSTAAFLVGGVGTIGNPTVPDGRYTGLVDDVQLYDNALSDSNIAFLFANPGQTIPEPAALSLLSIGGLALLRRRR